MCYYYRDSTVNIGQGAFNNMVNIRLESKSRDQLINEYEKQFNSTALNKIKTEFEQSQLASEFISLSFPGNSLQNSINVQVKLKRSIGSMEEANTYRISPDLASMQRLEVSSIDSNQINFEIKEPGIYVVKSESNNSVLIGSLVGVAIVAIIGIIIGLFLWRNPKYIQRLQYSAANAKRSLTGTV